MHQIRHPNPLRAGDRVSIIAPSGPVPPQAFEEGLECIKRMGLEPVYEPGVLCRDGFLAGNDDRRATELMGAISTPDTAAIWAARGGYGATRLLPRLSLDAIRQACKTLIGFSDITALHAAWQRAGLSSVHAANVTSLPRWGSEGVEHLRGALFGDDWPSVQGQGGNGIGAGDGVLVGGNLTVLAAMAGTHYFPRLTGGILFIEDVNEAPYRLDRVLTQLNQTGVLARLSGIAIGQLTGCTEGSDGPDPRSALEVIQAQLGGLGLPMVWGLPVGHEPASWAVPLGRQARVDSLTGCLSFPA